ncbi:hypothetical protein BD289DRAFT_453124 [Coniella lustricola]|uniref:Uncharacterized protein n=1 Tax=Coniella lustricola TaxID=2025994 RepID=A0A2T3A8E4_9PEZI|nr:hypothetical protein BD289DRAFT_453124 [Coniella lustricola]
MSTKATPILVAGRGESVATVVVEHIQPEYEVIHVALAANIENELPLLLQNKIPEDDKRSSFLGSGNWSTPPKAVVFGGAFTDDLIEKLQKLVAETKGSRNIPWLRVNAKIVGPAPGTPEYAISVSLKVKEALQRFEAEGKLDVDGEGPGEVLWV